MQKISSILILFLFFLYSLVSYGNLAAKEVGACDGYSFPVKIQEGSANFSDACLDTDIFRAAKIVDNNSTEMIFENYLHDGKYWTATVPKNIKVENAYLQVVRFTVAGGVIAGHVQYRVKLPEGESFGLKHADGSTTKVNDLVVSFEAARPKGVKYNFATGMRNNYVLVGRVSSGLQRLKEYKESENDFITEQYVLNLPENEKVDLLFKGVQASSDRGYIDFYDTLKPNCTTEAFDIIDQLPSVAAKKPKAFLTMLSNDPVVGPTVQGLIDRDLLMACGPDMYMDKKTEEVVVKIVSTDDCKKRKQPAKSDIPFMVQIDDLPYSIIVASSFSSDQEKLKTVEAAAYGLAPQILQQVGASVMLGGTTSSTTLLSSLKSLKPLFEKTLTSLEDELGSEVVSVAVYISPWWKDQQDDLEYTSIEDVTQELGVQAQLPLKAYRLSEGIGGLNAGWAFNDNLSAAAKAHKAVNAPFGFLGLVAQVTVDKNNGSKVTLQSVGYSSPLSKPMVVKNDQVVISDVFVPEALNDFFTPVSILTLGYQKGQDNPELSLEFGGLEGTFYYDSYMTLRDDTEALTPDSSVGLFKIQQQTCMERAENVPYLNGSAAKLKIANVKLKIFAVDFDMENLAVSNIEVRTDAVHGLVQKCKRDVENVNMQFVNSANAAIEDQKKKVTESPGLSLLSELIGNN